MKPTFSIVVPAFNEEKHLEETLQSLRGILDDRFSSYEVIIVNDGSSDATAQVAERLTRTYPFIRVLHHPHNLGLGSALRSGYRAASKEYVMWFTADNGMVAESVSEMFRLIGKADIVVPYMTNPECRPWQRRLISKTYTFLINFLFGLSVRYFNGGAIYRTEDVKDLSSSTEGFAFMAETLVRLIKQGRSYIEFSQLQRDRLHGRTKAFRLKNVVNVLKTIGVLFWKIRIRRAFPKPLPRRETHQDPQPAPRASASLP